MKKIIVALFILTFQYQVISQKPKSVEISGTVYVSSSISSGIVNGGSTTIPKHPFGNQFLYIIHEKDSIITKTTQEGFFTTNIVPGTYTVYQEGGLKKSNGLNYFDSSIIIVKEQNEPFEIVFKNHSNRRAAMQNGGSPKSESIHSKTKIN